MKLRSKDIANLLGISPATVSLVQNNKPGVSEETRQKVLALLNQNNSTQTEFSNPAIHFIIYRKHGKIVADTSFFSTLTESINREARKFGYHLSISYIDKSKDNVGSVLQMIRASFPAGIILLATEMSEQDLPPFHDFTCPVLLLDAHFKNQDFNIVCIDNEDGVYKAVKHMDSLHPVDVGYIDSSIWITNYEHRLRFFRQYAEEFGYTIKESNIFRLDPTYLESAYQSMLAALSGRTKVPSVLISANDILAAGAIQALTEKGFRIPTDVSVIGFDDIPICELCNPPLTTIHVHSKQMARAAVRRLSEMISENPVCIQKILIVTELIIRKSTL